VLCRTLVAMRNCWRGAVSTAAFGTNRLVM
jgi:hypothetical protein